MFTATTKNAPLVITIVICSMMLVAEGLPLARRERGTGDLIDGEAFLSMLLGRRSRFREDAPTTTTTTMSTITTTTVETEEPTTLPDVIRETRSSPYRTFPSDSPLSRVSSELGSFSEQSSDRNVGEDGMIVSVSMSSSSSAVPSEQRQGLVAEANKSALGVDEGEPITREYEPRTYNYRARSVSYGSPAQIIPRPKKNATEATSSSAAETKDYYVTSKYNPPPDYNDSLDKRQYETTERNWGYPPKNPYTPVVYAQPEQNYEVDEAVSVETNGRAHGVQPPSRPVDSKKKDDNQKVGYVVEGRNYRKYRVEERTSDGFIVGEYGVVSHDDGSLRGVRYTADGTISPRLIYDALMKFLSL